MNVLETVRSTWISLRSVVTAADWPTHTNAYNPATTATHRLATHMLAHLETDLEKIDCTKAPFFNALELRARLSGAAATCTFHIFGRRGGNGSVKLIATVVATAGSQVDAAGNYFATTLSKTVEYWPKTITVSSEPSGSGMCTLFFDTMGWSDFWIGVTALSAGTIYFDYAGF
jgi:hypothetical protein